MNMAITEPVTVSLFEIQPEHEQPDELSGVRDGWQKIAGPGGLAALRAAAREQWRGYDR